MNSLLRFRQQIIESSNTQQDEPTVISIRYICADCENKTRLDLHESCPPSLPELYAPDCAWQSEIDWVLEKVRGTEARIVARCLLRGTGPATFFSALDRLTKALLQQKSRLRQTTPEQPMQPLEQRLDETCRHCGKPAGNDQHAINWREGVSLK